MTKRALAVILSSIMIIAPTISTAAEPMRPRAIEKRWIWYNDEAPSQVTGETIFYCDGGTSGSGVVTGTYVEEYYGCP